MFIFSKLAEEKKEGRNGDQSGEKQKEDGMLPALVQIKSEITLGLQNFSINQSMLVYFTI